MPRLEPGLTIADVIGWLAKIPLPTLDTFGEVNASNYPGGFGYFLRFCFGAVFKPAQFILNEASDLLGKERH